MRRLRRDAWPPAVRQQLFDPRHRLRHTHASHTLASGVPIQVAQQNLGHASIATTTLYVSTEKAARLRAMQGFWAKRE